MKHKKTVSIFLAIFFSIFSTAGFVKASVLGFDTSTPCTYWEDVFNFSMSAAGVLTLAMLVLGGLYYIVSLGQEEKLGNAKKMMTGALAGFMLAIFSFLIFRVISPSLLQCRIDVPEVILPEAASLVGGTINLCAGLHEDSLFDEQSECEAHGGPDNAACEGSCIQWESDSADNEEGTVEGGESSGEEATEGGSTGEGNGDIETDQGTTRWCCISNDSALYQQMMSFCPTGEGGDHLANYRNVVNNWINILPGRAVYVGGGTMHGGTCNASSSDTYLSRKLQSGEGYRSQWVDPVGGDINQAMSNYRAWAQSLGGTYCGDCLTFTRTLYQCVGVSSNVINLSTDRSAARYYFNNPREFAEALQNGSAEMVPGTFIWFGEGCGHAINYTGISGSEIIEMGGGGSSITANGYRASTINVTSTLQSYVTSSWLSRRDCPVYVHRMLE
jgi:hypothetical protein